MESKSLEEEEVMNCTISSGGDGEEVKLVAAQTRAGIDRQFGCDESVYDMFGFHTGDRVQTPKGLAWVVGSHKGDLYFHIDGDKGASKWTGLTRADFAAKGFSLVFSPYQQGRKRYSATDLLPLVNNEQFSDVCFVLDDESKLYASRGILSSRSEYFEALLKPDRTQEGKSKVVAICGVDREAFKGVLEFLYTGDVHVTESNAIPLIRAADLFTIEPLKELVASLLLTFVRADTVLDYIVLADQLALHPLKEKCQHYFSCSVEKLPRLKGWNEFCRDHPNLVYEMFQDYKRTGALGPNSSSSSSSTSGHARTFNGGSGVGVDDANTPRHKRRRENR